MTDFTEAEEKILNDYYPPRTGELGEDGDEETGEWSWEGWEHDEVIPWSFSSSDGIGEEEFLVLYNAWNANQSISITEINRLGHVAKEPYGDREGEEMDSYEYLVMLEQRSVWRVGITENMGLHSIRCIQTLPKQIKSVDIMFEVRYDDFWDPDWEDDERAPMRLVDFGIGTYNSLISKSEIMGLKERRPEVLKEMFGLIPDPEKE